MTQTHTPGPGEAHESGRIYTESVGKAVAIIGYGHFLPETCRANGHLIAAAPDLLSALERCEKELSHYVGESTGAQREATDCVQIARLVIALARGGAR